LINYNAAKKPGRGKQLICSISHWLFLQGCATCKTGTNFVPITPIFADLFVTLIEYSYGTGKLLSHHFLQIHIIVLLASH
jgi:hypothetical protein